MSLTFPILSDICAIKINELTTLTKSLNSRLNEYKQSHSDNMTKMNSDISTQNIKIDLIHNLFNEYKSSSNIHLKQQEIADLKLSQKNLINSIKNEYGNIIKNVNNNIRDNNIAILDAIDTKLNSIKKDVLQKKLLDKISFLEKKVETLESNKVMNHINSVLCNLKADLADINFRLNRLDNNYTVLEDKLRTFDKSTKKVTSHVSNIKSMTLQSYPKKIEEEESNWIKVTKKNRNKKI